MTFCASIEVGSSIAKAICMTKCTCSGGGSLLHYYTDLLKENGCMYLHMYTFCITFGFRGVSKRRQGGNMGWYYDPKNLDHVC